MKDKTLLWGQAVAELSKLTPGKWKCMFSCLLQYLGIFLPCTFCARTPSKVGHRYQAPLVCFLAYGSDATWNEQRKEYFSCGEMINWVIQPSRGCTRPASPLGDSKMPTEQQIFTAWIAMRLERQFISDLWETSSWTIKYFPTTFCCCHLFFPWEICELGLVLMYSMQFPKASWMALISTSQISGPQTFRGAFLSQSYC